MEVQESDSKKKTVEVIGILNGTKYDNAETGVIGGGVPVFERKEEIRTGTDKIIRYKGQYELIGLGKPPIGGKEVFLRTFIKLRSV